VLIEEESAARPEHPSADHAPEPAGQMFMIRKSVEALLENGEPLPVLKPAQAWRRITDHLRGTGIHARELPHRTTYNRFRKKYGCRFGLR
jgi:hypothetical protein